MFESDPNNGKMIETTDCLETIGIFKAAKNFFFLLCIIALIASQVVFWMADFGVMAWDNQVNGDSGNASAVQVEAKTEPAAPEMKVVKAYQEDEGLADAAKQVVAQVEGVAGAVSEAITEKEPAKPAQEQVVEPEQVKKSSWQLKWAIAANLIKVCNAVLVFAISTYCLILLFSLKISLVGRFGGMSKISGAFLLSLFAALFVMPWQLAFPGLHLYGAVYMPVELMEWVSGKVDSSKFYDVCYYLRFAVSWFAAVILLVAAQLRSAKWSKAILKRLGIIQ